ncbi:DUF4268 domain-containing protein [Sphingobium tyrosinilyticum]|uniref:DUF4268 domain-containing protein n=1 Tax=Sphingobium tyrosinilyticum TaxID=2715436 RepID=A0ABV9EY63_9SPHN
MDDAVASYLAIFTQRAKEAGLDMRPPGKNWAPMRDIVPGSHVSLSLRRDAIQVNLNNERDEDRRQFESLYRERATIQSAIGESLSWEQKDGRKKTAVRATLSRGYGDRDWGEQHRWAIGIMQAFEREFGSRLRASPETEGTR